MKRLLLFLLVCLPLVATARGRRIYTLNTGWKAVCYPEESARYGDSLVCQNLQLPHNFDDYYGARQLLHGNLHGEARYNIEFSLPLTSYSDSDFDRQTGKHYRLRLNGAGSYVTVVMNGDTLCRHQPAGRVVTTLPVSKIYLSKNRLTVICHHPSRITDLPWVCGGCSSEWGFSEGSQPLGLFRGVEIEELEDICFEPFGVHVWSNAACDTLFVESEVSNDGSRSYHRVLLSTKLHCLSTQDSTVAVQDVRFTLKRGQKLLVRQTIPLPKGVSRWSPEHPNMYQVSSELMCFDPATSQRRLADRLLTDFGFRSIQWGRQLLVNGEPVFVNGVCEYEHAFGHSHALPDQEIDARMLLLQRLGYNAVREAHQPHNLRYVNDCNRLGILYWAQFSAHIWYDTPAFRENFKTLLRQWVRERRNDPSVVLWGLQNESTLPADFARECADIIREMDPQCRPVSLENQDQLPVMNPAPGRLITTCNGGSGTDWNVIQNWSGTYGGNLDNYAAELKQNNQLLNGEYGAWRTLGLHDTLTIFNSKAPHSEEKFAMLLGSKMQQAVSVRDSVCGHFQWLLYSHDNPGRWQPDEALRLIDKVGPFNYKGLYSPWGQPTEFAKSLLADTLCHYEPDEKASLLLRGTPGMTYLYRLNCGGDSLTDSQGQHWMGDDTRFSSSWAQRREFAADSLCPVLASQGITDAPVAVAYTGETPRLLLDTDQPLVRSFRWGRGDLKFTFPVDKSAPYIVELFSVEPWASSKGQRSYNVTINGVDYAPNLDIWQVCKGRNLLIRSTLRISGLDRDSLVISFPHVQIGQAVVSAIAVSTMDEIAANLTLPSVPDTPGYPYSAGLTWAALDTMVLPVTPKDYFPNHDADRSQPLVIVPEEQPDGTQKFAFSTGLAHEYVMRFRYRNTTGSDVPATWELRSNADNRIISEGSISYPVTPPKYKTVSTTTGSMINAGSYTLILRTTQKIEFENLTIE